MLLYWLCYTVIKDKKGPSEDNQNVKESIIMTKTLGFKFNLTRFFLFIAGFIVLWLFGDILFSTIITQNGFVFGLAKDILVPLIIVVPTAAFTQLLHFN